MNCVPNSRRYVLRATIFVLLLLLPIAAQGDEEVDPGQTTFRSTISELDFEQIDPYSGNLSHVHKDVEFPGNGGLDLVVYRTYQGSRNIQDTALGGKWDQHFGRLRKSSTKIAIELQDGTVNTAYSENLGSTWYWTKDFWKIGVSGTPTLYLPDGTVIVFGRGGTSAYDNWYYATEIRKNNNVISIHYNSNRWADYVIDSVGRRLDFNYSVISNIKRLVSISCAQDPEQRQLVIYIYPGSGTYPSRLSGVSYPDGDNWGYRYNGNHLARVLTPYGGQVDYQYDIFYRATVVGGALFQHSIKSKTVSGSGLTGGTWNYDYGMKSDTHLDYTTITDPCDRTTTYHFFGYSGGYDTGTANECYKYGLTRRKYTTDSAGTVEEAVEYIWDKVNESISSVGYNVAHACSDAKVYVPVLVRQNSYNGGSIHYMFTSTQDPKWWEVVDPTDIYVARYDTINGYGHAGLIREYNEIPPYESTPAEKTTNLTYWYNENLNIVEGKPASVRVRGSSAFPGDFTTTYTYNGHGNITEEDRSGVITSHTYYANGNPATTTDANNKVTSFQWQNGTVSKIINPLYTTSRTINWDGTVASETNGEEHTTSYRYTPGMRLERVTPPAGNPIIHGYGFGANSTSVKTRGGFSDRVYYDGLGRERSTLNSLNITNTVTRKSCGLIASKDSTIGDKVIYDNRGRIERINHKDGTYITFNHISDSEVRITDEERQTSINYYHPMGNPGEKHLVRHRDALGRQTSFTYNVLGRLLKTQRDGLTRSFTYDSRNYLES